MNVLDEKFRLMRLDFEPNEPNGQINVFGISYVAQREEYKRLGMRMGLEEQVQVEEEVERDEQAIDNQMIYLPE